MDQPAIKLNARKDFFDSERVYAEVVLKAGVTLSQEDVIEQCQNFLAGYKIPKSVAFVEAIPLTAEGKVDKVTIRNRYAEKK